MPIETLPAPRPAGRSKRRGSARLFALIAVFAATACGSLAEDAEEPTNTANEADVERLRYTREFVFLGRVNGEPTIVPFSFRSVASGEEIERSAIAWLGRGATWDRFLEETHTTSAVGGVWRVVPQTDLAIIAGGPTQLEALLFERDERRLRMEISEPETPWIEAGETRFRLLEGAISLGNETTEGSLFEILDVDRILGDGWPPEQAFDALFLTSADSIQLVIAEGMDGATEDGSHAWLRTRRGEASSRSAEVRWVQVRTLENARRESWSFRVPELELEGEVEAVGYDVVLGPERSGRRAVEIRFSVEGWYENESGRRTVVGMVRHLQQ